MKTAVQLKPVYLEEILMMNISTAKKTDRNISLLPPAPERLIVVGDVHGDLPRLKAVLRQSGLIDNRDTWTGEGAILVQLGDSIDRTPDDVAPFAAFHFLQKLQCEAGYYGGRVIRLLGNHELMLIQGRDDYVVNDLSQNFYAKNARNVDIKKMALELGDEIKEDILSGRVLGAWSHNDILFVHAGLRTDIRHIILEYVHKNGLSYARDNYMLTETISTSINQLLRLPIL